MQIGSSSTSSSLVIQNAIDVDTGNIVTQELVDDTRRKGILTWLMHNTYNPPSQVSADLRAGHFPDGMKETYYKYFISDPVPVTYPAPRNSSRSLAHP
jgi:hypothetical protein